MQEKTHRQQIFDKLLEMGDTMLELSSENVGDWNWRCMHDVKNYRISVKIADLSQDWRWLSRKI